MTREEAIAYGKECLSWNKFSKDMKMYQFIEMAIKALSQEPTIGQLFSCEEVEELRSKIWKQVEQEPCDDAISREAVNTLVDELARAISDERCHIPQRGRDTGHIMHDILDLPSVTQKSGKWIEHNHNGMRYIECPKCSSWFLRMYLTRNSYCPNCGAKMESEDKE